MAEQFLTFEGMIEAAQGTCYEVMIDRQRKYGPHNITRHDLLGIAVRLGDKLARLDRAVLDVGTVADDESLEDTLVDIVGYGLIGLCVHRGWWTKDYCPPVGAKQKAPAAGEGKQGLKKGES